MSRMDLHAMLMFLQSAFATSCIAAAQAVPTASLYDGVAHRSAKLQRLVRADCKHRLRTAVPCRHILTWRTHRGSEGFGSS